MATFLNRHGAQRHGVRKALQRRERLARSITSARLARAACSATRGRLHSSLPRAGAGNGRARCVPRRRGYARRGDALRRRGGDGGPRSDSDDARGRAQVVRTQLGQLYEAAGSYERARDLCGGDRPITPQTTQWQNIVHNLVLVLLDLERREDAQVHARRAAEIAANDAEKCASSFSRRAARVRHRSTLTGRVDVHVRAGTSTDLSHRGDRRRRGGARVRACHRARTRPPRRVRKSHRRGGEGAAPRLARAREAARVRGSAAGVWRHAPGSTAAPAARAARVAVARRARLLVHGAAATTPRASARSTSRAPSSATAGTGRARRPLAASR